VAEIPSTHDGIVKKLHYKTDDVCLVGHVLADIELEDGTPSTNEVDAAVQSNEPSHPIGFVGTSSTE
jgi:pyruvate/2-oxoglutarate dehydrogenase complex dihydrolipoamide acyltransferase (E2) component